MRCACMDPCSIRHLGQDICFDEYKYIYQDSLQVHLRGNWLLSISRFLSVAFPLPLFTRMYIKYLLVDC